MQISLQTTEKLEEKKKIRNWIWPSLFVLFFMFFVTGIPAVIFAIISRVKLKKDDIEGADKAAKKARILTIMGFWIGLALLVIEITYYLITGKSTDLLWFT